MGILSGLLGKASDIDVEKLEKEFEFIAIEGERIEKAYRVIRDLIVFTSKRLVLVNKQGVTGKKTEYHSVPYHTITRFSVESAGHFDADSELKIWVEGSDIPIQKEFKRGGSIFDVQKTLSKYVLKYD